MRCDEVARELSAPSGRLDPSAVSAHLENCEACAAWAHQVQRLDRLWNATRPAEPPPRAFDTLWAKVAGSLDQPQTLPMPPRPALVRRLAPALVSAAAACLLIALWMGRQGQNPPPVPHLAQNGQPAVTEKTAQVAASGESSETELALALYDLEQGPTPIIRLSDDTVTIDSQPLSDVSDTVTVAAEIDILNYFETLGL